MLFPHLSGSELLKSIPILSSQLPSVILSELSSSNQTDLKKSDEIGEEQEHGLVADPLQHPEHDEGAAIYDEPGGENGFHSPD